MHKEHRTRLMQQIPSEVISMKTSGRKIAWFDNEERFYFTTKFVSNRRPTDILCHVHRSLTCYTFFNLYENLNWNLHEISISNWS